MGTVQGPEGAEWIDAPEARITELVASERWAPLLPEVKLGPHRRHFFRDEIARPTPPATHLRVNIYPDGGLSRVRVWGTRS